MKTYYVYILSNKRHGVLIGMTNDLIKRVYQHRHKLIKGFTRDYNVRRLVYYESTNDVYAAILREKRIKKWYRQWKIELIEKNNPQWRDLYYGLTITRSPLARG